MAAATVMDVGSITKMAAWAGRRLGGIMESFSGVVMPVLALVGCILAGCLVLGQWLNMRPAWTKEFTRKFRSPRSRGIDVPDTTMDDLLDKMCEVDMHVKQLATKAVGSATQESLDTAMDTLMRRFEVLENSVQGTHDRIQNLVDAVKKVHARLDEVHAGILKAQAALTKDTVQGVKDSSKAENKHVLTTMQDKFDKILKEVQLSLVETQKITSQSTQPIKRSQEGLATALNDKTTEILKELSNVFHRVKKEGGDCMAMVRWTGSKVEAVESLCAHQPERLQILRDTLLEVQTTVVRIQTEMEANQGDDARASSPTRQDWAQQASPPQQQPAPSSPNPTAAASSSTPHTINLEETVPVQLMRPNALNPSSPLTSLALADGRVIYVPRQVVSSLFGAQF